MRSIRHVKKGLGIISLSVLSLLLVACSQYNPSKNVNGFLINEVYVGTGGGSLQWIEIINNGDPKTTAKLAGWVLTTQKGSVDLGSLKGSAVAYNPAPEPPTVIALTPTTEIPAGAYILIASSPTEFKSRYSTTPPGFTAMDGSAILGNLNAKGDVIALKNSGEVIDQLGWGDSKSLPLDKLGITTTVNLDVGVPSDEGKSIGRTPAVGARDPDAPGFFTVHNSVSAVGGVPQPRDRYKSNFFISNITDYIGIAGGVLMWAVFVMIAFIARRFQELAQQKTYWQYLLVAPFGILVYAFVTAYAFSFTVTQSYGAIPEWRNLAFFLLFVSGIACLYVVNIFRLIAKNILEAE